MRLHIRILRFWVVPWGNVTPLENGTAPSREWETGAGLTRRDRGAS